MDSVHQSVTLKGKMVLPEVVRQDVYYDTYILEDEYGNETTAVMSTEPVTLDATPNDIRLGKTAATGAGVTVGDKEIPSYHTTEGIKLVMPGSEFKIQILKNSRYDYTKLQVIICPFNETLSQSAGAVQVVIDNSVYNTPSPEAVSSVTIDHDDKTINLGVVNDTDIVHIVRFFTYKEEY